MSSSYYIYMTCSDYPDTEALAALHPGSGGKLTPWQERHALLVLAAAAHLRDLRFVLCPRRMDEERFWSIYFRLDAWMCYVN